jgi:hypothetical protein
MKALSIRQPDPARHEADRVYYGTAEALRSHIKQDDSNLITRKPPPLRFQSISNQEHIQLPGRLVSFLSDETGLYTAE